MQQNSRSRRNVHDRRWTESRRTLEAMSDVLLAAAVVVGVAAVMAGLAVLAVRVRRRGTAGPAIGAAMAAYDEAMHSTAGLRPRRRPTSAESADPLGRPG